MLHEVFLVLSGHPSPLCSEDPSTIDAFSLTDAEKSLLEPVGRLGRLHRALRPQLSQICQTHSSVICRSVANAILTTHLSKFQQHIEQVERQILSNDARTVGAYNIVPLASVLQGFDVWRRRIDFLWDLTCYMYQVDASTVVDTVIADQKECSGPALLDNLSLCTGSGYEDIERTATNLLVVGEKTLFRLLSCWLLTGQLSEIGRRDSFVQQSGPAMKQSTSYNLDKELIPASISVETASSILFVGRTLKMLMPATDALSGMAPRSSISASSTKTMQKLHSVTFPLKSARLATVVSDIRRDLSMNLGQTVLPMHALLHNLHYIRDFLLAGRPDLIDQLIDEADKYLEMRNQQTRTGPRKHQNNELAGITMKSGEIKIVMDRTWASIELSSVKDAAVDETEWGRVHLKLALASATEASNDAIKPPANRVMGKFDDFLLAAPVELRLDLDDAFDIVVSSSDQKTYTVIHSYLLAIKRAHNHVSRLWKDGACRKSVMGHSSTVRMAQDGLKMRKILATCSMVVFTLSEIGSYFAEEVIPLSWATFQEWAMQSQIGLRKVDRQKTTDTARSASEIDGKDQELPHDPETLAIAHHHYLECITKSLLLTNESWTRTLRSLLTYVDQMVAFVTRLQHAQQNIHLYSQDVDQHLRRKYLHEEEFLFGEAKKSCSRVDEAVSKITTLLKTIAPPGSDVANSDDTDFEPWQPGNGAIERLLLRLDMRLPNVDAA